MHEFGAPAARSRRQVRALAAAGLAALLSGAAHAASPVELGDSTSSISRAAGIAHEVRISFVKSGREGLELSARLSDDGGTINRPVSWTVRRSGGGIVYQGETPVADLVTEPGDYRVEIAYGAVRLAHSVALLANQRLGVSFVLNAGGIRVLPRIVEIGPSPVPPRTRIFAISGEAAGRLVATTTQPGEIIRVGAGTYRIESRFEPGNTLALAQVRVKPGRLSAVEIDHRAGLARLRLGTPSDGRVNWTIEPAQGEALRIAAGTVHVALKPGAYRALARTADAEFTADFSIAAGEARDILVGP